MSVRAKDMHKVLDAPAIRIMKFLVDIYGRSVADDIARKVASDEPNPDVVWPKF